MSADVFVLPANQPADRFYRGGARIARFRGQGVVDEAPPLRVPEDWVASVTTLAGEDALGLSRLPDGRLLVEAIEQDPELWLGPSHVARFGADARLLVKLLDAGQRLPVHAHPDGDFAGRLLGRVHGKAEAWHVLAPGEIYLGLRTALTATELRAMVDLQDAEALLASLHRRSVEPGQTVYVPPGVLHAIGEGVFLVELQEPEDLSVLLEWRDFELDGAADGHLGLGFDVALKAVDRGRLDPARLEALISVPGGDLLPPEAEAYFRVDRLQIERERRLEQGYAVLVVIEGELEVGGGVALSAGTTAVVPHAVGPIMLRGHGEVVVCRPPRP